MTTLVAKLGLASELIAQQRSGEALQLFENLAALTKPSEDGTELLLRALAGAIDALIAAGQSRDAHAAAVLLASLCPPTGDQLWYGRSLARLGTAVWYVSGPAAALPLSEKALAVLSRVNDLPPAELVRAYDNLGLALHSTNAYAQAMEVQTKGLDVALRSALNDDARRIKRRLANTLQDSGAFELAARLMSEIRPSDHASAQERIGWHNATAMLAERRGRIAEAASHYRFALTAFDDLTEGQSGFAALLSNAALLFLELGNDGEVNAVVEQLGKFVEHDAPLSVRLGYERLQARLKETVGDLANAEHHWANASRLVETHADNDLSRSAEFAAIRARLLLEVGEAARAQAVLATFDITRAHIDDHVHLVEATIERVRATGDETPADEHIERLALAFVAELERGDVEIGWRLFDVLADWTYRQGNTDGAILLGKLATRKILSANKSLRGSHREQLSHWRARAVPQFQLLRRLVDAGRLPEAEQVMASTQFDRISTLARRQMRVDQSPNDLPFHDLERNEECRLAAASTELRRTKANTVDPLLSPAARAQASSDLGAARRKGREVFEAITRFHITAAQPAAANVATEETFPQGKGVLRILPSSRGIVGVLYDSSSTHSYEISPDKAQFSRAVYALRAAIMRREANWQEQANRLHDLILRPVATRLIDLNSLDVSAWGPAQYIPFACLHDRSHYLVEKLALSFRSGAPAIRRAPLHIRQWRVAAFGSTAAQGALPALPHLKDEIAAVNAAFPKADSYIDTDFTREALANAMSAGVELLHIAAHYQLAAGAAHRSFMSLGDGTRLSLSDFASTGFDASRVDLAVLSGCDTGTIDDGFGGAQSMAGVLQAKGARDVIAALWPIADAGAAHLARSFYRNLVTVPPGDALRAAQIEVLNGTQTSFHEAIKGVRGLGLITDGHDFTHPYYWAGFAHFVAGA